MTSETSTLQNTATNDLDPDSLAAIRDLMTEAKQASVEVPSEVRQSRQAPVRHRERIADVETSQADTHHDDRAHQGLPDIQPLDRTPKATSKGVGLIAGLRARSAGIRLRKRLVLLIGVVLTVFFWPWLVFGFFVFSALLFTGTLLILGYDGFWCHLMNGARWYARKHPSRSSELHLKLDGFAMKFDAFLDRFPEGTVDGFYLPDFGGLAAAEARHDESLDRRFGEMREGQA